MSYHVGPTSGHDDERITRWGHIKGAIEDAKSVLKEIEEDDPEEEELIVAIYKQVGTVEKQGDEFIVKIEDVDGNEGELGQQ